MTKSCTKCVYFFLLYRICGGQGCNQDSLQSQIKLWSKKPNITYIGSPAQSWIDDYFGWSKDCCRSFIADGKFCPSDYVDPKESSSSGKFTKMAP